MGSSDDPYECLGLAPGASVSEIKRAYKRAAQRHHPDRNLENPHAHEDFLRVQWAYRVLLDGPAPPTSPSSTPPSSAPFREPAQPDLPDAQDGYATIEIRVPLERVGQPFEKVVSAKLAQACPVCGGGMSTGCPRCAGTGQILRVRRFRVIVPARTPDGTWLIAYAVGHHGPRFGRAGDVRVQVRWKDTGVWAWEHQRLVARIKLSAGRLRKGGRHPLRMPDGQWIWWTVPAGTQAGQWFKCPALSWGGAVSEAWVCAERGWALFSPDPRRRAEKG